MKTKTWMKFLEPGLDTIFGCVTFSNGSNIENLSNKLKKQHRIPVLSHNYFLSARKKCL